MGPSENVSMQMLNFLLNFKVYKFITQVILRWEKIYTVLRVILQIPPRNLYEI